VIELLYKLALAKHLVRNLGKEEAQRVAVYYEKLGVISREDLIDIVTCIKMLPESNETKGFMDFEDHMKAMRLIWLMKSGKEELDMFELTESLTRWILTRNSF